MVGELTRRQNELVRLLEAKDREIQDYKDNGATVSRREDGLAIKSCFKARLVSWLDHSIGACLYRYIALNSEQ